MTRLSICAIVVLLVTGGAASGRSLSLSWRYPTGGIIRSEPAVGIEGNVYALSDDGHLYSFSDGGKLLWTTNLGGLVTNSLSVGPDGTIYAGLRNGHIVAVNPNGSVIWKFDPHTSLIGDPATANDGTIFVATSAGTMYALSITGALEWTITLPARLTVAPILDGQETVYLGAADQRLYALTRWGRFKWSLPLSGVPVSDAAASNNSVFLLTEQGALLNVSSAGDIEWERPVGNGSFGPLVGETRVFVADHEGKLSAYSLTGQRIWTRQTGARLTGQWVLGRGRLYLMEHDGRILVVRSADGAKVETKEADTSGSLTLSNTGNLIVGGRDWVVYAYSGAPPEPNAQWAQPSADQLHSRHGAGRFHSSVAVSLLSGIPDYIALSTLLDPGSRDSLVELLDAVHARVKSGTVGKSRWYVRRLLERVASVGVLNPVVEGNSVVNNFPLIRTKAAGLLGHFASLDSRSFLIRLLRHETDRIAAAAEIAALGAIGSDPDGASTTAIAGAVERFSEGGRNTDPRIAEAAVGALRGILRYEGELDAGPATTALLRIVHSPYPARIRSSAARLLGRI